MKKNYVKLSLIVLFLSVAGSSFANPGKEGMLTTEEKEFAVNSYVNSFCHGQHDDLLQILNDDTEFNISSPMIQVKYKAPVYKRFLEKDIEQNCLTNYELWDETAFKTTARVTIDYPTHSQTIMLYITKDQDTGNLLITKVDRYFN